MISNSFDIFLFIYFKNYKLLLLDQVLLHFKLKNLNVFKIYMKYFTCDLISKILLLVVITFSY